jgi:hypothetical protein
VLSDAKSGVIQVGRPLPRPLADAAASSALRPSNVLRPRRRGPRTSPTALAWDRYARALCGAGSSIANHPNIAPQRNRRGPDTTLALVGVLAWCRFSRKSSSSSREVEIRLVPARWWAPSRTPWRSDTRADRGPELSPVTNGARLRKRSLTSLNDWLNDLPAGIQTHIRPSARVLGTWQLKDAVKRGHPGDFLTEVWPSV